MNRRGFLTGIIAACAAPAIIRTPGLIMPIKPKLLDVSDLFATDLTQSALEAILMDWYSASAFFLQTKTLIVPAGNVKFAQRILAAG